MPGARGGRAACQELLGARKRVSSGDRRISAGADSPGAPAQPATSGRRQPPRCQRGGGATARRRFARAQAAGFSIG
eukprot:9165360-Pyramimonas_sp.AAC.1